MKKTALTLVLILITLSTYAQKNPIDAIFDKYSGMDGITSIFISSKMFSMMADIELDDEELEDIMDNLKTIRIMTVEDHDLNQELNFYKELQENLDLSGYEELMVVKESGRDIKFMIKEKGKRIEELLMIGGGAGSNMLVSIKGDLDMNNISEISKTIGIKEFNEERDQLLKNLL